MLTTSFAQVAAANIYAAASNIQTVAFDLSDSSSGATDQQIFFPQGESPLAFGLIFLGVIFGIALGFFLSHLMFNKKVFTAGAITVGYFAVLGFVTTSLGVAASFWIGLATVGGFFWARRVSSRMPNRTAAK